MKNRAVISCIYLGFISQVAQVVILREALATFAGVEMVMGSVLAVWLVAVGCGGFAGNKIHAFRAGSYKAVAILLALVGALLPISVMGLRQLPTIFDFAPGEIIGAGTSLLGAQLTISPLCFLLGLLFTANARLFAIEAQIWVGMTYLLEAAGAAFGGLLVTFILLPLSSDLVVALGMIPPTIAIIVIILERATLRHLVRLSILFVIWFTFGAGFGPVADFDRATRAVNRAGGEVIALADSPHGQLAVTRYIDQYSMYINGTLASSYPDQSSAEEAVHFALLAHPAPKSALLIGGGVGGAVGEMRKHGVTVDYVELDPRAVTLAGGNFPPEATRALADCRVITGDGRLYLSRTDITYDVIILNLGEPSTAMINRFFTSEFFMLIKKRLSPGGVFSFRVLSAEDYISPERGLFLSTLYRTLKEAFAAVVVLPGATNIFIAGDGPVTLSRQPGQFIARLHDRGIHNNFINESMLPFRLTEAAGDYLDQHVHDPAARLNTDLRPVCYFYNAILWSRQFAGRETAGPPFITRISGKVALIVFAVGIALILLACRFTGAKITMPFLFSLFISGLTAMAMEIILLYCFQVYLGVIYAKVGMLVACFMVGMSVGSFILNRRTAISPRLLAVCQGMPVVVMVGFLWCMTAFSAAFPAFGVELLFYSFSLIFGGSGGALFVVANRLYMSRFKAGTEVPVGTGYAVDLAGSALGALIVSSLLLPVRGVGQTIGLLVTLNLIVICIVLLFGRIRAQSAS